MRKRSYKAICLLLLFSLLHCLQPTLAEISEPLPIIHLQTTNMHPGKIGAELGREVRSYFPDIERQYDSYLAGRFSQHRFDTITQLRLPAMLAQLDSHYSKELYGVASAWSLGNESKLGDGKLSLAEYQVLNLLSDLGAAPDGSGFAVLGKASVSGSPIVGRNLDWSHQAELRQLQAITVYQDGDRGIVNIGFAGLISVITGFNEQGLFAASMSAEPFSPYLFNKRTPVNFSLLGFDLRKVLATHSTVKKSARYLAGKHYTYSHNILLADPTSVKVLEQNNNSGHAPLRTWNSRLQSNQTWQRRHQIAVVDCFVLSASSGSCTDPKDIARWKTFRSLATFSPETPASTQDIVDIMHNTKNFRYEIFNQNTLQSIIFQPEQTALQLYHIPPDGEHPQNPVYTDYPRLLPNVIAFNIQLLINALIWSILLIMLGVVFWQIRKHR